MPVKRISLQFRTKSVVAQPAIPEPPTPPSSQESFSYPKAESLVKSRPSRLKPSVPLHMTTRRHKSELQSAHTQPQLSNNTSPTTTDIPENIIRKMPPKRKNGTISEYHDSDERLKKRLRGPKSNGASQSSISVDASNEENNTSREASKDTQIPPKRPRGRPPLKPRPSTSEKIDITIDAANSSRKESHIQDSELKSTVTSRAPSDIVRPKVPREELFGQYYRKQANALKHATTEQIRRRQAKLAAQYSTLAQLAKKNNTWLIDKSIDVLSNVKDVDLARTEWALSILEGLEKWEDARVEQINYEKRIGLLNAFHSYNAERDRLDTEFTVGGLSRAYKG